MTPAEFQMLCVALRIDTPVQAGELLGMSWRTAQRYWYGETAIPGPLARLLRIAARKRLTHNDLRAEPRL
jgi:hypothetical protein